jgi:hypothetical protein
MTLLIRPVKMNKSIYVRVPNDIAHIIGLDNRVEVSFSFEDKGNELHLIYSLDKSQPHSQQAAQNPTADSAVTRPSNQPQHEAGEQHATKVENDRAPQR